jgi:hypothetical protein
MNDGCMVFPTLEYGDDGVDLRRVTSSSSTDKLCVGVTTRKQLIETMGPKFKQFSEYTPAEDAATCVLKAPNCWGYAMAFSPPPFGPFLERSYFAKLDFGKDSVLYRVELRRESKWSNAGLGMSMPQREWLAPTTWPDIEKNTELVARMETPLLAKQ